MTRLFEPKKLAAPVAAIARSNFKVILPILLVLAISGMLLVAPPAQAVTVSVSPASGTATIGSTYSFTVTVNVMDAVDKLPIQGVDLHINNGAGNSVYCDNLPMPITPGATGTRTYTPAGAGTVNVYGTGGSFWGVINSDRYGYGYGYSGKAWTTDNLTSGFGYGYGYGTYVGPTTLTYNVAWVPPAGWPVGDYTIEVVVYGDAGDPTKAFSNHVTSTITLQQSGGSAGLPGGGGSTTAEPAAGTTDVSTNVDSTGKFVTDVKAKSKDKKVDVSINRDTVGKDANGNPLTDITITPMDNPPTSPGKSTIGLSYDLGPDGATFDPAITVSFEYDPADIPNGVAEENLTLAVWNGSEWVELTNVTVNPVTHTISGDTTHFTEFAIIASTAPANIVGSSLSITPAEIDPGEAVKISFMVTNEGDLAGQEDIVLLVNGTETNQQAITLLGGESREMSFSMTRAAGGTYTVEVAGLKGTFTVTGAAVTPPPTSPAPTTPAPAPAPSPTTPAPAPTPPPTPEPTNWMMIILISIAAVIVIGVVVWYAMRNMR